MEESILRYEKIDFLGEGQVNNTIFLHYSHVSNYTELKIINIVNYITSKTLL